MTCDFTSLLTVFLSYQDDERLIMKVCAGGGGGAAGILKTPPIHIISRLTKHTYSHNLHVKKIPCTYNRKSGSTFI